MDSDDDEISFTFTDVLPLILKTFKSFVFPLFVISVFFSMINIILMFMMQNKIDPSEIFVSISMHSDYYQFLASADVIKYSSSLQGPVHLYLLGSDGCLQSDLDRFDLRSNELSLVMISKGNCTLYSKILNAQQKGFSAVLLNDQHVLPSLARELSNSFYINILSINSEKYWKMIEYMSLKPFNQVIIKSNLKNVLSIQNIGLEILINLLVIYMSEFIVMSSWLIIYTIGNILIYRRFKLYQLLVDGCLTLLASTQDRYVPKLRTIPPNFPEKILDGKNIQDLKSFHGIFESEISSYHDSCSICLEEFQIENKVRLLPCRHLFHSLCIDPWLLDHNRLCPVCQQDVLKSCKIRDQENIMSRDNGSEESLTFRASPFRENSIHYKIVGWIQRQLG